MLWLRKTSLTGLVWLTATMTVVAGMPHFLCQCSTSNAKDASPSAPAGSCCCCSGGPCRMSDAGCCHAGKGASFSTGVSPALQVKKDFSFSQVQRRDSHLLGSGSVAQRACRGTLVELEVLVSRQGESAVDPGLAFAPLLSAQTLFVNSPPPVAPNPTSWPVHWSAPPLDLVTTLQHLTI
jgi:hypothetical protein